MYPRAAIPNETLPDERFPPSVVFEFIGQKRAFGRVSELTADDMATRFLESAFREQWNRKPG
jgi:hypothetical protein